MHVCEYGIMHVRMYVRHDVCYVCMHICVLPRSIEVDVIDKMYTGRDAAKNDRYTTVKVTLKSNCGMYIKSTTSTSTEQCNG